jgi:hypothetical protein
MPYEQCQAVVVRGQSGSHRRQLSWVRGNVGGGEPFDYIIADPIVLPDQTSQFFDERSFVCPAASCRVVITSERSTMLRPIGPITISGRNGLCFAGSTMSTRSIRLGLLDDYLEERGAVGFVAVRCGRYRKTESAEGSQGQGRRPGSAREPPCPSLFDAALYTRRLETAYEAIYQRLAAGSYRRSSARMRTTVAAVGKLGRQFPKGWTAPSPLVDSTIRSLGPTAEGLRGCCRPLAGTFDGK